MKEFLAVENTQGTPCVEGSSAIERCHGAEVIECKSQSSRCEEPKFKTFLEAWCYVILGPTP